jgi:hypothetical protein
MKRGLYEKYFKILIIKNLKRMKLKLYLNREKIGKLIINENGEHK